MSELQAPDWSLEFIQKLGARQPTFAKILCHLHEHPTKRIIETGTARIEGNWEGDGQSTLIWDKYANIYGAEVLSIDISPKNVEIACKQCSDKTTFMVGDSVFWLNQLTDKVLSECGLLYLDSFDLDRKDPSPSAFHHMKELCAIYAKLPPGCLIVVDDRIDNRIGKHYLIEDFFNSLKIRPIFSGYQIGWVRP